jgi:hypothetical protein
MDLDHAVFRVIKIIFTNTLRILNIRNIEKHEIGKTFGIDGAETWDKTVKTNLKILLPFGPIDSFQT